ncbi:MAG: anthranilate synthase component I family protein, partial [Desulfohalobiaceae bacterium]
MKTIVLQQYGQHLPADTQTPIGLFRKLVGKRPGILLESAEVDGRLGRYSLLAWDFRLQLDCRQGRLSVRTSYQNRFSGLMDLEGEDYLPGLRQALDRLQILPPEDLPDLPPITRALYGYFGYSIAGMLEPKLAPALPPEHAEAGMVLPGRTILFDHLYQRCLFLSLEKVGKPMPQKMGHNPYDAPTVGRIVAEPGKEAYCDAVRTVREMINQGEAIQVVLSTRFQAPYSGEPFTLYRRLRQLNPSPYMYFIRLPGMSIVGSSPELMVRCEKNVLEERPIAGTRPRGRDIAEDTALSEELLADPKERAEHVMLVDLGRNDLGRVCRYGTVTVDEVMVIERYSHVMHIVSNVTGELAEGHDALDALMACIPAGTLTGAPKVRAMEIIDELEPT